MLNSSCKAFLFFPACLSCSRWSTQGKLTSTSVWSKTLSDDRVSHQHVEVCIWRMRKPLEGQETFWKTKMQTYKTNRLSILLHDYQPRKQTGCFWQQIPLENTRHQMKWFSQQRQCQMKSKPTFIVHQYLWVQRWLGCHNISNEQSCQLSP